MASFLYGRTITLSRIVKNEAPGEQGYGGDIPATAEETVIQAGLKAHIEAERQGNSPQVRLPGDAAGQSIWIIVVRKAALGLIRSRDVITDELGQRYQVISADWGPMVTSCRAQILEA